MASTFSSLLRIELIGTGDQSGTWGNTTNTNLGTLIEQAIAGTATVDVSVGNVTLTSVNGSSDQSRCAAIRVIGTPGTARNIIAPALSHIYVIANGSDGVVTIKTSTSTGVAVPVGEVYLVYYDPNVAVADFRLVGRAARSTNTANTLVLRDGSGNFAAGTITASDFVGDLTGDVAGSLNGPVGNLVPNTGAFTTLSTTGNTTLGNDPADTLTVNATPTFNVRIPVGSGGTGVGTLTGIVRGNGTSAFSAASPGVDYAPATTGTNAQLLANNGSGGFSNVTLAPSLQYTGGTLSVVSGGGMVYPPAGIPLSTGSTWSTSFNDTTTPITVAYGGTGSTTAGGARTNLGATTLGGNLFTITNPSAITFPRFNADNTVSALSAADFRTAIGVGTGTGTVTSITAGAFLTGGTITTSGTIAVDATNLNTPSKVVARDASGNFSAGTITANLTGTATSASTAISATTATNVAGGGAGRVVFNTGNNATSFTAQGSNGQLLQSAGTGTPTWVDQSTIAAGTATTATNIAGGGAGRVPYNTGSGATAFVAVGSAGQALISNGTSAPTFGSAITLGNALASPSVTPTGVSTVTFIGIPSWVNRVTVILSGISPSTNGSFSMQLGTSSGFVTSGYTGGGGSVVDNGATSLSNASTAISVIGTSDANTAVTGTTVLTRVNGNTWVGSSNYYRLSDLRAVVYNATITLPASLDRLQLVHSAGNFDAGTINIMYE